MYLYSARIDTLFKTNCAKYTTLARIFLTNGLFWKPLLINIQEELKPITMYLSMSWQVKESKLANWNKSYL